MAPAFLPSLTFPRSIGIGFSLTAEALPCTTAMHPSECGASLGPCPAEACKEKKGQEAFTHHPQLGSSKSNEGCKTRVD